MVQKLVLVALMALSFKATAHDLADTDYFTISSVQTQELSKADAEAAVAKSPLLMNKAITYMGTVGMSTLGCEQAGNPVLGGTPFSGIFLPGVMPNPPLIPGTTSPGTLPSVPGTGATPVTPTNPADVTPISTEIGQASMVVDQIINLGKKIWGVIDQGKPVVNMKMDAATALPRGAKCWADLQNWQAPKYKVYSVSYKNLYGVKVVDFTYRVLYVAGGSVNGKGQYIAYAAVEPLNVAVMWGFHFNVEAAAPAVYNMGNRDNPLAAMNLQLKWSVDPVLPLQHLERTQSYFITGRGELGLL